MNHLFPIFIKLEQFKVLIVGGGKVGLEKITALLNNSPRTVVTLVAEDIKAEIFDFCVPFPQVILQQKRFEPADLEGQAIVIAATDDKTLNQWIQIEAKKRQLWVNVADTPDLCDFYLSSVVQKGDLKIAISTHGKSPTIAKRLKQLLQEVLPDELNDILQNMSLIRARLKGNFAEKVKILNEITSNYFSDSANRLP